MNDVYIIESWFGERRNLRQVYAADADDALQTHALHYPGRTYRERATRGWAERPMRLLAQFVAVLLVGFVGAYFWWIVAAAAAAVPAWLAVRAYPVGTTGTSGSSGSVHSTTGTSPHHAHR